MNKEHYNELIDLSQKIYEYAADTLTNYCSAKYCGVGNDTTEQQMEDHLIVAEEVSAYLLGNMLAMLTKESQEDEIKLFEQNLRRVIAHQTKKAGGDIPPSYEEDYLNYPAAPVPAGHCAGRSGSTLPGRRPGRLCCCPL